MYTISYDKNLHRTEIILKGILKNRDIEQLISEFRAVVKNLEGGFTMLTDLREGKVLNQDVASKLNNLKKISEEKKVKKVAIISDSPIMQLQAKRILYDITSTEIIGKVFENMKDAQFYLNNSM